MSSARPEQEAKEIELKLLFDPADAQALLAHPFLARIPAAPKKRELISVYYDTDDDDLQRRGVFLRVRSTGEGYVQTIKTARGEGEFLERDEWESRLATHAPNLDAATGTALAPLLTEDVCSRLRPRFQTRFQRDAYNIDEVGSEIELAVDRGEITAGAKAAPVSELELELKSGGRQALFLLARTLVESLPLTLGVKTKAERGFELLDAENHGVEKARPVEVSPNETCAEAFRIIARNCLRQILVNLPALHARRSEALHQVRVGLRRLRAAIALFGDVVSGEQRQTVSQALKWITGELGPARDLDVFINDVLVPHVASHADDPQLEAVYEDVLAKRAAAYDRAIEATRSSCFRLALIDLGAWIEIGDWTGDDNPLAEEPIAAYAAEKLSSLRRAIKKKGENIRKLSAPGRHRLRICAKRLRYATEFFARTFVSARCDKRRRKLLVALQKLQDALGILNDISTRQVLLAGCGDVLDRPRCAMTGIDPGDEKGWLREAKRAYARFAEIKAFWKG